MVSATLRLTRELVGIELRRGQFDVVLDGKKVSSIDRHESVDTAIEPGHHALQIRAGRYSSQIRSFDASEGQEISFRCHGAAIWPRYVASVVKPDLAISLKQD